MKINGRRGGFQLMLGIGWLLIGIHFWMDTTPSETFSWFYNYLPYHLIGVPWFLAGVTALISSFLPRPKDWLSFALLTFAPASAGGLFIFSLVHKTTDSFIAPIVYFCLAGMVMIVSGMQGPADRDIRKIEVKL